LPWIPTLSAPNGYATGIIKTRLAAVYAKYPDDETKLFYGLYGVITAAQPSRQIQLGMRFAF
jgi:hypothetical protein